MPIEGTGPELTENVTRRWTTVVFGVVSQARIRRRPGDIVRVVVALFLVTISVVSTNRVSAQERRVYDFFNGFPSWVQTNCEWVYRAGTVGLVVVVLLALLFSRQFRLTLMAIAAGATSGAIALALRAWADTDATRQAAFGSGGPIPEYPAVTLAIATGIIGLLAPFLVRPARRVAIAVLLVAAAASVVAVMGLPEDLLAAVVLGWGVAAAFHLGFGTPAATPTRAQIATALEDYGVSVENLQLAPAQVWGETRFTGTGPSGEPLTIDVIGRDAGETRMAVKLGRSLVYRDSGPSVGLTRTIQLEHRAYVLLLAARAGVPVGDVVIAGIAGAHDDAVFVKRDPGGVPLDEVDPDRITDAVLDDAWTNLGRLRAARISHGRLTAANVRLLDDGTTAFVDFAYGSAAAPAERRARDSVEMLVSTAALVGVTPALAAAQRALGNEGLGELLPMFESQALSPVTRHSVPGLKKLLKTLREEGATLTGEEAPKLTELRRVSPGDIVMAAATFLGFYLIVEQFAGIDLWATLQTADVAWVLVAFLISPIPQFTSTISLKGAVAAPLPYGPVLGEQFANNFTGLIGGTLATTALVIRFFQKQGLSVAVAASSGVLNSLAAGMIQVVLVIVGLIVTSGDYDTGTTGSSDSSGIEQLVILGIILVGVALTIGLLVPKLRRLAMGILRPQLQSAKDNLKGILSAPRKAAMLFGGNLASQILFALVLDASLHAYGYSLPLMQLIVINSLASVLGGMAPVPGGMGVVEAGLIAGLTAAGIPTEAATATVFTHRLFTAYLPPIYGWFALQWLRRNDYV
jgi:uncharacterized membrane protein YbhN (UPF0104 family)